MIIIEGPDNAGKSTLVRFLESNLKTPVHTYHSPGPTTSSQELIERQLDLLYAHQGTRSLIDRMPCISEEVYGILLRGINRMEQTSFLNDLKKAKIPIIYCRPPMGTLLNMSRHQVREDESIEHVCQVVENQRGLVERYDEVMSQLPHFMYDYTVINEGYLQLLLGYIEMYWDQMEKANG